MEEHRDPTQATDDEQAVQPSSGAKAFLVGLGLALLAIYVDGLLLASDMAQQHPRMFQALRAALHAAPWIVAAWLAVRCVGRRFNRPWILLGLGVLLPLLLITSWAVRPRLYEHTRQSPFISAAWHADSIYRAGQVPSEERIHMIEDLMERRLLDGRTKDEVLALLGPDDGPEGTARASHYFAEWDLRYRLGPIRFMPVDDEWLVVRFGDDGLVKEYEVVTD